MQKWFHVIGISGKATANIALMFKDMGWFVTGSDHQFLPPASEIIIENKIPYVTEYNFKHLTKEFWQTKLKKKDLEIPSVPDLILVVESLGGKNKEYLFAKNKGLDIRPYSQILSEYLVKDNSIVIAGTAGKTTTTAIITKILSEIGFEPSYMIGAEVLDLAQSLKNTDSEWSIIEGDEYHSKEFSKGAKFLEYKPKYLVLTNIGYEHQDIFPTQKEYLQEFEKLAKLVPQDGLIVARHGDKNISETLQDISCNKILYTIANSLDDVPQDVWSLIGDNSAFTIYDGKKHEVLKSKTDLLGEYVLEDMLASVVLICSLPARKIPIDIMSKGVRYLQEIGEILADFKGVKKRLEILYSSENITIIDDFGVAPNRAKNSLKVIKERFPSHNIIAVFEPNNASRIKDESEFKNLYEGIFSDANEVIIPDLSKFNDEVASEDDFLKYLTDMNIKTQIIETKNLLSKLYNIIQKEEKSVIVFFSSYRLDSVSKELAQKAKKS